MRVYGKVFDEQGNGTWEVVTTDANGFNDNVYLTALCQVLLLNTGESPFYADRGIPSQQSVLTQIAPDYYVMQEQQQNSQYFASLIITRVPQTENPAYRVQVVTHSGAILERTIPT